MKKTTSWVCGNVAVVATLNLPDGMSEGLAELASAGLTQILQRKPSSAWEKAEAGYDKRPEGFKRDSIGYSDASAEKLEAEFVKAIPAGVQVAFQMSQHVAGETAKPSKESEADWVRIQSLDEDRFAEICKVIGLDPEDYDDEKGIRAVHAFNLKGKREAAVAAEKAKNALLFGAK